MSYHNQYDETVSIGDWIGSLVLSSLPIIGFIMMLVWAFGSNAKPSKRNFFRAALIVWVAGLALSVLGVLLLPGVLAEFLKFAEAALPSTSGFYK